MENEFNGVKLDLSGVKLDLTKPIEQVTDQTLKVVRSPLQTLSNIINNTFSFLDVTFQFGLNVYKYNLDYYLAKLKNKIDTKTKKIPTSNLTQPDIGIVGDILETMKYNLDKDYLIELYSSLIARNMDSRTKDLVHPSFVSIVKNLSIEGVELLKAIYLHQENDVSYMPFIQLDLSYGLDFKMPKYFIDIKDYNPDLNKFNLELEILIELKLINIDYLHTLKNKTIYDNLLTKAENTYLPLTNQIKKQTKINDFKLVSRNTGILNLSNIGFELCTILFESDK